MRIVALQDSSKIINLMVVEGQIEGAVQQGTGFALMENPVLDKKTGRIINADFANYMILTAMDMATIKIGLVEACEATGPLWG